MSLCDTCPRPGACCHGFPLSRSLPIAEGVGAAIGLCAKEGLPFYPIGTFDDDPKYRGAHWPVPDGEQIWTFACTNLTAEGRCGDYENRPLLCRIYTPLSHGCALHYSRFLPAPQGGQS